MVTTRKVLSKLNDAKSSGPGSVLLTVVKIYAPLLSVVLRQFLLSSLSKQNFSRILEEMHLPDPSVCRPPIITYILLSFPIRLRTVVLGLRI